MKNNWFIFLLLIHKGKAINVHLYAGGPAGSKGASLTSLASGCPSCMRFV